MGKASTSQSSRVMLLYPLFLFPFASLFGQVAAVSVKFQLVNTGAAAFQADAVIIQSWEATPVPPGLLTREIPLQGQASVVVNDYSPGAIINIFVRDGGQRWARAVIPDFDQSQPDEGVYRMLLHYSSDDICLDTEATPVQDGSCIVF